MRVVSGRIGVGPKTSEGGKRTEAGDLKNEGVHITQNFYVLYTDFLSVLNIKYFIH